MKDWKSFEKSAEKGPLQIALRVFFAVLLFGLITTPFCFAQSWCNEAATVAKEEFGPRNALKKYEWFKNASAELDKKLADINVYEQRIEQMQKDYDGTSRKDWDRLDKEQFNQWYGEVAGVKASYNSLAAEWNSQISKFNWRPFLGELPPGAEELLSKEYAPYQRK